MADKYYQASKIKLSLQPGGSLVLRHGRRLLKDIRLVLERPLSAPDSAASILDSSGIEQGILLNLQKLDKNSRAALDASLRRHYLQAVIKKINALDFQFGAVYFDVDTDRGRREFVIRGVSQHVRWLSDDRMIFRDVDGNRFEIVNRQALDKRSQRLMDRVL